jgi:sigma-B regulation protein RsbU (phosphoserine phosphatase)
MNAISCILAGIVSASIGLWLLAKGKYYAAAHIPSVLGACLVLVGVYVCLHPENYYLAIAWQYFMYVLIIHAALFCHRYWMSVITLVLILNNILFFVLGQQYFDTYADVGASAYLITNIFSLSMVCLLSYLAILIGEKAITRAENEATRNKELNITLEKLKKMNTALRDANEELEKNHEGATLDMAMAVNVQKNFLLQHPPASTEWDIAFISCPMAGISGDFYDFYTSEDQLVGVSIFDVSGHGIASGLLTMIAKSIVFRNFTTGNKKNLGKIFSDVNAHLVKEIGSIDNYLTGILMRFTSGHIEYVNAGHHEVLYKDTGNHTVSFFNRGDQSYRGSILGMREYNDVFRVYKREVHAGDCLLLYTDALHETTSRKSNNIEQFGHQRICKAFQEAPDASAEDVLNFILEQFYRFSEKEQQLEDDLTIIILKKL